MRLQSCHGWTLTDRCFTRNQQAWLLIVAISSIYSFKHRVVQKNTYMYHIMNRKHCQKDTCLCSLRWIAPHCTPCYNQRNDDDGDDVGRCLLAESRRMVRGGSRARAQSPPESPGKTAREQTAKNKEQNRIVCCSLSFVLCCSFGRTDAGCAR